MLGLKPENTVELPLLFAAFISKIDILPVLNSVSVCVPVNSEIKSPEYKDLAFPDPKTHPVTPVSKYRLVPDIPV